MSVSRAPDRFELQVLDRLERIEVQLSALSEERDKVTPLWLSKRELAKRIPCSVRWLEGRMLEGLPRREMWAEGRVSPSRVVFNLVEVELWLQAEGRLRKVGR